MRILAIRGKNLASLSSEFEVDFQSEPLVSAGLFAITGATGSGKSTLLDALCLALYERTPRLTQAGVRSDTIPDVGDSGVAPSDTRTILRRGASEGYAEVDFVGSDAVAYRARWSVRRAYNRASGNLQDSKVTLERLRDRQVIGDHRKGETLKLIESRIGLSFDQFRRAVLLAQNDFATFLKASDDERAELLQTLTGTETFAEISKQAYARMKSEREALDQLAAQLAAQAPLAAELRCEKDAALAALGERRQAQEAAKRESEAQLRWLEQFAKQQAVCAQAQATLAQAEATRSAADERFARLALIEAVQPARACCAELDRLTLEIAAGEQAVALRELELQSAQRLAERRQGDVDALAVQLVQAEARSALAQPQIDAAKALDAKLAVLSPQYRESVAARDEALAHQRTATAQRDAAQHTLQQTVAALAASERWLSERAAEQPLAEGWQRWETLFAQALSLHQEMAKARAQIDELSQGDGTLAVAVEAARRDAAAQAQANAGAQQALAAQAALWQVFDSDAMARRQRQLDDRREWLATGGAEWAALAELRQRRAQGEQQAQALLAVVARCSAELAVLGGQRPACEQACVDAERALQLAQLAASESAEAMRALLQEDKPCPVCGGVDHPYATHSPQADAMLKALAGNVESCRQALAELSARIVARSTEGEGAQRQRAQVERELAANRAALDDCQTRWETLALRDELSEIGEDARAAWFAEQQVAARSALDQLAREENDYRQATKLKESAQAACNRAQQAFEKAQAALRHGEDQQRSIRQEIAGARLRLAELDLQSSRTLATLDGAGAGWREQWATAPQLVIAACRSRAQAWLDQQQQCAQLSTQIDTLRAAAAHQSEAASKATLAWQAADERRGRQERELKALQNERLALFAGLPIKDVEAQLASVVDAGKAQLGQAQGEAQKAGAERTRLDESWRLMRESLLRQRADQHAASRQRDDWLAEFNAQREGPPRTAQDLQALLAPASGALDDERKALQRLDQAVDSAAAVLAAQQRASQIHAQDRPPTLAPASPVEELSAALAEVLARQQNELATLADSVASLKAELVADDARVRQSQLLRDAVAERQKTARVWSQLGELIGSADGKKFRNFAQQLTLDILLGYGNRQLESLSRRYRLERITGSLGLLVVDQDMGDEVRSVHSLSGGESFLVSLALALGLASLSSHRVRVESLFIDEGFGSLDSDSLRVAMDALDKLQAQGRKVGVISHVEEMNERIGTRVQVLREAGGRSRIAVV